jgi:hypothetical protein
MIARTTRTSLVSHRSTARNRRQAINRICSSTTATTDATATNEVDDGKGTESNSNSAEKKGRRKNKATTRTQKRDEKNSKEEEKYYVINERLLRCQRAKEIGTLLKDLQGLKLNERDDANDDDDGDDDDDDSGDLSVVNISTIFSILGKKCTTGDSAWDAAALEHLIKSAIFREKVFAKTEVDGFTNNTKSAATIMWSIARLSAQTRIKCDDIFEKTWTCLENGLERVCTEQRTLLFEDIFPEYMPPRTCASIAWAYTAIERKTIPEHLRDAIETIIIRKNSECCAGDIAIVTWSLTRFGVDIASKNRNKYWKTIKERLMDSEIFEKGIDFENASRLISASGQVSGGFHRDFVRKLVEKAASEFVRQKKHEKVVDKRHVVAMLNGLAANIRNIENSNSSAAAIDQGGVQGKMEREFIIDALKPIFEEIIEAPYAFKPTQLPSCAKAIARIVFSRAANSNFFEGDDLLKDMNVAGSDVYIDGSEKTEDDDSYDDDTNSSLAIQALESIFKVCTTDDNLLSQFKPRDYTTLLWALIKSRSKISSEFLEKCEDYAIDNLDSLNVLDLVYFTYSLGNVRNNSLDSINDSNEEGEEEEEETYNPTRFLSYAVSRAEELADCDGDAGFDVNVHIAPILNSFAKNRFNPGMTLIDKCEKIIQRESSIDPFRPTVASQIMWSFTKLEYMPSDATLEKIEAAWLSTSSSSTSAGEAMNFRDFQEGSSLLIWAYATLGKLPSIEILQKLTQSPTKNSRSYWTPVSMWMTFWSLSLLYACVAESSEEKTAVASVLQNFCENIIIFNGGIRVKDIDKKGLGACYASILLLKETPLEAIAKEALPGDFEKVARNQWIIQKRKDSQSSKLQEQVGESLRRLKIAYSEEREVQDGLMRPDFFIASASIDDFLRSKSKSNDHIPSRNDVVLEVDGPHHFAISASTGKRSLLGSTSMRNVLLRERLGLRLGVILFNEWGDLQSSSERDDYVTKILLGLF